MFGCIVWSDITSFHRSLQRRWSYPAFRVRQRSQGVDSDNTDNPPGLIYVINPGSRRLRVYDKALIGSAKFADLRVSEESMLRFQPVRAVRGTPTAPRRSNVETHG